MDPATTSLFLNLTATGIAAGASITASSVQRVFRRQKYNDDLEHVATVFAGELKDAIEAEDARRETNELTGATDHWKAVVEEVTGLASDDRELRDRERNQIGHLFADEEDAAIQIAEAIATVQGFNLANTPQLRTELIAAVGNAYTEAVAAFEQRIAGTDLVDVFQQELQLDIREELGHLKQRMSQISDDVSLLLTQAARNEGFRQLSPLYFKRTTPTPETSWRTTFTLADVHAEIPARRDGYDDQYADEELVASLREGEDRLVVGRAGAGKSTLCKQVAVAWSQQTETGAVLYRDSDEAGAAFESREALREAIDRADGHVLLVVEDAIRANASAIFRVIEEYDDVSDVTFLLDARATELDADPDAQTLDRSSERRHQEIANAIKRYNLPAISEEDITRTINSFEEATGTPVERSASKLHEEIQSKAVEGFGAFLLLSFHLPFGDAALKHGENETGLEAHVRSRYQTLADPGSDGAVRDLSRFDADLLADVGVMVNLLNASGIGIYPELVHTLGNEYGHDIETHDEIHEIREALENWFLFQVADESEQVRSTHELWSTLYLRVVARDHYQQQASSRRRDRSEPHVARCIEALFALFNNESHRGAVEREFPDSSVLAVLNSNPEEKIVEYLMSIFELTNRWPVLAPLAGNTDTARYDLPASCSYETRQWVLNTRGSAHLNCGAYQKARAEFERQLDDAENAEDRLGEANSLNNLGNIARSLGEYEQARKYHQHSLEIFRELGNRRGKANSLNNLGLVTRRLGEYEQAREYHQHSLEISRDLGDRRGETNNLGNLGNVAQKLGEYEQAREYYQHVLEIERKVGDRQGEANSLNNLGNVARRLGEYEQAREYHQHGLKIFRELGDRSGEANSLNNLGLVTRRLDEHEQARKYHQHSLEIKKELGDRQGEATSLNDLGLVVWRLGEHEQAQEYHKLSLEIKKELGDRQGEANSLGNLGNVAQKLGEYEQAREYYQRVLKMCRDLGDRQGEANGLHNLGNVAQELGEYEQAHEYYLHSLEIKQELGDRQGEAHSLNNLGNVAQERGEYEQAREYYEQSLSILRNIGHPYVDQVESLLEDLPDKGP